MEINITIDCDDKTDLLNHLSVIRNGVKNLNEDVLDVEESECIELLSDNNCYGSHVVTVRNVGG